MDYGGCQRDLSLAGIRIVVDSDSDSIRRNFTMQLRELGLEEQVEIIDLPDSNATAIQFRLHAELADSWAPNGDTMELCQKLQLDTRNNSRDLEREILVAMLLSPSSFEFTSYAELAAAIRIRRYIVEAARKTSLAFATHEAERPAEFWVYDEDRGFILRPGRSLVTALQQATQPEESAQQYTFSCRRAGEYVVLLSMAQETMLSNPKLFHELHRQAEARAVKGREFEQVFQRSIGSSGDPLPLKFFVPGDRTWFRNPDQTSSTVTGYEGSWTFYIGNGQFADFWKRGKSFTLTTKCLAMFHWRNAVYRDAQGECQINENIVDELVERSLKDPVQKAEILSEMLRLQEPLDTFSGGCIEPHRDFPRQVCVGTADLHLPDV